MKTLSSNITSFSNTLNSAVKIEETKMPKIKKNKRMFLTLISLLLIIVTTCSCNRNVSSGCGAWPMANKNTVKNFKGESKTTNTYKNNKQFESYKGFN